MQPASILHKFRRYQDRPEYLMVNGQEPPLFDKIKPPKHWEDTTLGDLASDAVVTYNRLPRSGETMELHPFTMSVRDASHVNIAGAARYATYMIAPTPAVIVLPGHEPQGINPMYLSSLSEANRIKSEIGGEAVFIDASFGGGAVIEYNGEVRRAWVVRRGTAHINAGMAIAAQYARGVQSPGHWDKSLVEPAWVSEILPPGDTSNLLTEVDEPVDPLPAGATLVRDGLMQTMMIRMADEQPAPTGTVALPHDFDTRFTGIESKLTDISERLKKLGV